MGLGAAKELREAELRKREKREGEKRIFSLLLAFFFFAVSYAAFISRLRISFPVSYAAPISDNLRLPIIPGLPVVLKCSASGEPHLAFRVGDFEKRKAGELI